MIGRLTAEAAPLQSSGCGCDGMNGQHVVHGAGAVALRVQRNVSEAEGPKGGGDAVKGVEGKSPGQVWASDLDPCQVAMVSHTDLREAERVQRLFGALYLAEVFGSHGAAVFDARGEACAGRLVCQCEAGIAGEHAHLSFAESGVDQRREHTVTGRGALAGAMVATVVEVHAVGDVRKLQ